jgi:transcriptional regulator with XRE-family HTH domain
MKLAERIRQIRLIQNLTQEEVAERCGMAASSYGQIERKASTSSFETLNKIAHALNVKISFLVDMDSPITNDTKIQVITCCKSDTSKLPLNDTLIIKTMQKVPFTQAGFDLKRQMINDLPEPDFLQQLEQMQHSTRQWWKDNFIFNQDQEEYIDAFPQFLMDFMGISLRGAIQFNEPHTVEPVEHYQPPLAAKRKAKPFIKGGGTWNPGTGEIKYKVEAGIKFPFP